MPAFEHKRVNQGRLVQRRQLAAKLPSECVVRGFVTDISMWCCGTQKRSRQF
jgi:hypothetical protein